jgi:hypothetical protein
MTRVRGVRIMAAPCCGAQYSFPNYVSINFSAFEYWTDGWREHSLMPNDEGLRRCQCGQFVMTRDMVAIESSAVDYVGQDKELPFMERVSDEVLSDCISKATSGEMEVAARLGYWKYLNHDYRVAYRLHRDAEEAAIKSAWDEANPDLRTWWDKLLRRKPILFKRPINSPFTIPVFETTQEQRQNMQRLGEVLLELRKATGRNYVLELAELYREQGHFHEAELELSALDDGQVGVTSQLILKLIQEKQDAPMRFRM